MSGMWRIILCVCLTSTVQGGELYIPGVDPDMLRIDCGPITCDITYQYCNTGLLGTRSVCSLCDDICAQNRVGRERIFVQHCLEKCPVYWYRQLLQKAITTTTHSDVTSTQSPGDARYTSVPIWMVLVLLLCILCTVLLASILAVIVHRRKPRHRRQRANKSIIGSKTSLSLATDSGFPRDSSDLLLTNLEQGDMGSLRTQSRASTVHNVDTATTGLAVESVMQTRETRWENPRTPRSQCDATHVKTTRDSPVSTADRKVTTKGSGKLDPHRTCSTDPMLI